MNSLIRRNNFSDNTDLVNRTFCLDRLEQQKLFREIQKARHLHDQIDYMVGQKKKISISHF